MVQRGVGHSQNGVAFTANDVPVQEVHIQLALRSPVRVVIVVGLVFVDHVQLGMVRRDFNAGFSFRLLVQTVLLWTELLLLDTEEVQSHGDCEQNRSEQEQDLLLRLEGSTQEGVRPVKTAQSVTHCSTEP